MKVDYYRDFRSSPAALKISPTDTLVFACAHSRKCFVEKMVPSEMLKCSVDFTLYFSVLELVKKKKEKEKGKKQCVFLFVFDANQF